MDSYTLCAGPAVTGAEVRRRQAPYRWQPSCPGLFGICVLCSFPISFIHLLNVIFQPYYAGPGILIMGKLRTRDQKSFSKGHLKREQPRFLSSYFSVSSKPSMLAQLRRGFQEDPVHREKCPASAPPHPLQRQLSWGPVLHTCWLPSTLSDCWGVAPGVGMALGSSSHSPFLVGPLW